LHNLIKIRHASTFEAAEQACFYLEALLGRFAAQTPQLLGKYNYDSMFEIPN
jgi:hypothetical protein